jgi:hypothetical protein
MSGARKMRRGRTATTLSIALSILKASAGTKSVVIAGNHDWAAPWLAWGVLTELVAFRRSESRL